MSLPGVWPQVLDFFGTSLAIEPSPGQLSRAGLLPLCQFDQRIGLTRSFTAALDPRDPELIEHSFLEMVQSCVFSTFGLTANAVLQGETEGLLAEAVAAYEREEHLAARQQEPVRQAVPSRLFTGFWYQAGTWPCARYSSA
jgi:hypothetical protein